LKPCEEATGIFFRRRDVPAHQAFIAARWDKLSDTRLSTGLSNRFGQSVSTVEHLLAALRLCQIDNLEIDVDGPEIPIMDGSAKPFVETLLRAGTQTIDEPRKAIRLLKPVEVHQHGHFARLVSDAVARVTVSIEFEQSAIGSQSLSICIDDASSLKRIAPARTFGFVDQIEGLRNSGLALGGSLDNAILVDDATILNPEGLRFEDEFVRHKILDAIGDPSLAGVPVIAHYQGFRSGHLLNRLLIGKLLADRSAWSFVSMAE
jgi:UDP-3-O-[3-hydroxymyristoyl] N-acetylglucosamine deacetylase